jgi:hypothetical protein
MNAMPAVIDSDVDLAQSRESRAAAGTTRGKRRRVAAAIVALLAAGLLLAGATLWVARDGATAIPAVGAPEPAASANVMPSAPTDGLLELVIPPGAFADQQAGGPGYEMPSVIRLNVGDKIVIRNDDGASHMILYAFLKPGETHERIFTEPGSEVYSSGCGVHAASFNNFTSLFVSAGREATG